MIKKRKEKIFTVIGNLFGETAPCPRCKRQHPLQIGFYIGRSKEVKVVTCKNNRTFLVV